MAHRGSTFKADLMTSGGGFGNRGFQTGAKAGSFGGWPGVIVENIQNGQGISVVAKKSARGRISGRPIV
jgi:hypothetical protein